MPASFQIQLDTTAPQGPVFELAGGADQIGIFEVPFILTTTDPDTTGYTVKVWGDLEPDFNPDFGDDYATAQWVGYGTVDTLKLLAGDGIKTVWAVIRDDVGNETLYLSDSVQVDVSIPTVTITVDPDRIKISKVAPWDATNFTFTVDSDVGAYKVKVVPDPSATHDQGVQIPSDGGSENVLADPIALAENTPQTVKLTGVDLQTAVGADGPYYIKVFAQEATSGLWST